MTADDAKHLGRELSDIVRAFTAREVRPLFERLATLEGRLAAAEQRVAELEAGQ